MLRYFPSKFFASLLSCGFISCGRGACAIHPLPENVTVLKLPRSFTEIDARRRLRCSVLKTGS